MSGVTINYPSKPKVETNDFKDIPEYTFFTGIVDGEAGLFYKGYDVVHRLSKFTDYGRPQQYLPNWSQKVINYRPVDVTVIQFREDGRFYKEYPTKYDLQEAVEKFSVTAWVNMWKKPTGEVTVGSVTYPTKQAAEATGKAYVGTHIWLGAHGVTISGEVKE